MASTDFPMDSAIIFHNIQERKLPKDIVEARYCLQFMFTQESWYEADDRELQDYAFSILQKYPGLALSRVSGCYDQTDLPLLIMLRAKPINSNLHAIMAIYEMYPEAVEAKQYKYTSDLALHIACQFEASSAVIEFIAKTYPDALYEGNDEMSRPIHEVLNYCDSENILSTIQCLAELAPRTTIMKDINDRIPLETAIFMDRGTDVIEYLVSKLPDYFSNLTIDTSWEQFTLNENAARGMGSLLNKLQDLDCRPFSWTCDGFSLLMSHLENSTTIRKIRVELPLLDNKVVSSSLNRMLQRNHTIGTLVIELGENQLAQVNHNSSLNAALLLFTALEIGLRNNSSVRLLELSNIHILSLKELIEFFASGSAPADVTLKNVSIEEDAEKYVLDWTTCRVQRLRINNSNLKGEAFDNLFSHLNYMASMESLDLRLEFMESSEAVDRVLPFQVRLPQSMMHFLKQTNNLEMLSIVGYTLDMDQLCAILRENRTLKNLVIKVEESYDKVNGHCAQQKKLCQVLKNCNTTLEYVHVFAESWIGAHIEDSLIGYYTELNRFGRGQARNPNTTKNHFVNLLWKANFASRASAILYDLLRETPGLWISPMFSPQRTYMPAKRQRLL